MNFKEDEIINCTLLSLKHLRTMYLYFSEEAGTDELFQDAHTLFDEVTQMQRATYDLMIEKGFMSIKAQKDKEIQTAHQNMMKILNEMK